MKKVIALLLTLVTIFGLVGCQDENQDPLMSESKETLVSNIKALQEACNNSNNKIAELEKMLKGVQGEEVADAGIRKFSDGTGRLTLTSIDGIVELPDVFEYPNSFQATNNSSVNLNKTIYIKPSSNWIVRVCGTVIELQHTGSGISGKLSLGKVDNGVTNTQDLKDHMNEFFSKMPPEKITYNRIYMGSNWIGTDAYTHTFIEEDDAILRCGMLAVGKDSVVYMFAYSGDTDVSKDELVLTLLQSLTIGNDEIRIE